MMTGVVAIDTETGGVGELQCRTHALLSVGMYMRIGDEERKFGVYVRPAPGLLIDPGAVRVNGYSPEVWERMGAVDEPVAAMRVRVPTGPRVTDCTNAASCSLAYR